MPFTFTLLSPPPWSFSPYAEPRPAPLLLPRSPPRPASVVTSPGRQRSCRSLQPTRPRTPDTAAVVAILEVGTHADGGDVPGSVTPSVEGPRLPSRTGWCAASSRERLETRSRHLRSGYSGLEEGELVQGGSSTRPGLTGLLGPTLILRPLVSAPRAFIGLPGGSRCEELR